MQGDGTLPGDAAINPSHKEFAVLALTSEAEFLKQC